MKIRKILPILCMAFGLTLASPLTIGAAGLSGIETQTAKTTTKKETPGWKEDTNTGYYYYIKEDGTRATGFTWITIQTASGSSRQWLYYFNADGLMTVPAGKVTIGEHFYYRQTGEAKAPYMLATNTFCGPKLQYYAGSDGKLICSAVRSINGKLYGFNARGVKWSSGVRRLNGKTYYVNASGTLFTNGWKKIKKRYYYFDKNGEMTGLAKNTVSGKTYYYRVDVTKKNLVSYKNGWYRDPVSGKKYYATSNGRLATGLRTIDDKLYYFNEKGVLVTNTWVKYENAYYRVNSKGEVRTGWYTINGKRYYAGEDGKRVTGLKRIDDKLYYFNYAAVLQTGFQKLSGKLYYFDSNLKRTAKGSARTGWFNANGNSYYADNAGVIQTGSLIYKNSRYYLDPNNNGAMVKNKTIIIDGETCSFDSSGRQIGWSLSNYPWNIRINAKCNVLTVYRGNFPITAFLCSTGLDDATPRGTFTIRNKLYKHQLNGPTWGYYCSHIADSILFHSLPQETPERYDLPAAKYNLLGEQASEGCIRLRMGDAHWIYENIPVGTEVLIYDSDNPGPLGKPVYQKIPLDLTVDPTDPDNPINREYAPEYPYTF